MINLAVINLRDIIKFLKFFFIILIVMILLIKSISSVKIQNMGLSKIDFKAEKIIGNELVLAKYSNDNVDEEKSLFKNILESEFAILTEAEEELMELENQEELKEMEIEVSEIEKEIQEEAVINEKVITKIIEEKNKKDVFTNTYNNVKIKNESKYNLTNHTHTCESYTPSEQNSYTASGNFRTTDLNYSVAKVGEVLSNNLKQFGLNAIHNKTYHDYPAYSGSYTRSLVTINDLLKQNPETELIIDLHRDALGSSSSYGPSVMIGDEKVAQLMFVIGTDGGGLTHPDWINNLKVAIAIQEKAEELYPGLFKPMIVRNSRYNQHVSKAAFIIEVGATGNTLEECTGSMKYLANVIKEIMK